MSSWIVINRRSLSTERAGHPPCAGCHEPLSEEEISEGAEPCSNCGLGGAGTAMIYDL